ncbi:hypothetical protein NCCP2222_01870 [Sporosarcina sp. NCCP-2222]|uniref:hypothetical protein n=1 Tax=Sporosarcina sp. NCCP-2222 TaxID=2935073 RepID=UPI00207DA8ED|nr:hypothetical protein [Sporosarcina sp. NCCP-2222]GKV54240.1 hypothetical protein NCCP2222_01870 [Sporosarcina sp. NCCP-2222]
MRDELRTILVANVPSVNGEVWEPSAAGPDMPKPSLVLREGSQDTGEAYSNFTSMYEVWPFVKRTTFKQVDAISKEVVSALHQKRFDVAGVPHYAEYIGTASEDTVDEDWDALTRGLRFQIYSLAWLLHQPIEPDPVSALQAWSTKRFPMMQLDPLLWSPSDTTPALYWRIDSTTKVEPMNWGAWVTMQLNGHVITPDASIRRHYVDRIVRQLAIDHVTRMSDHSKMRFLEVSADDGYDPFRDGQIKLTVKFGVLREPEVYPFLKHAYFDSERGGEVHVE